MTSHLKHLSKPVIRATGPCFRNTLLILALAFATLSSPAYANKIKWCDDNTWGHDSGGSNCGFTTPDSSSDVSNNALVSKINSLYFMENDPTYSNDRNLKGDACLCDDSGIKCVRLWGRMSYLGKAYRAGELDEETFTHIGLDGSVCEDTPVINLRRAGYLRLISEPGNCIQSTADPDHNGATHLWNNCATGDNQQRRVISYDTSNHQLQLASHNGRNPLCLLAADNLSSGDIYISHCDTATSEQSQWLLQDDQVQLKTDTSKCMVTTTTSIKSAIVLGECSVGDLAEWKLSWTQNH